MPPLPMPPLLSRRQAQLVATIERLTAERGIPPTMREAARAMGVHVSRVCQLAASTEAKGAIQREPRTARSWRVVRPAGAARPGAAGS